MSTLTSASDQSVRIDITVEGVFGSYLCGRADATPQTSAPHIQVSEGSLKLGEVQLEASSERGTWTFRWKIPAALYDGQAHALHLHCESGSAYLAFIGDPQVLLSAAGVSPERKSAESAEPPVALQAKVEALRGQLGALRGMLSNRERTTPIHRAPIDLTERYGAYFSDATRKRPGGRDYIWFSIINYDFRIQRPQHLANELADMGNRVFYLSIDLETADEAGRFRIESMPHHGVFVLRLRLNGVLPANIYGGFTEDQISELQASLDEAIALLNITKPNAVVQYPSWYRVAAGIRGAAVIHDCLDYVGGFSNVPRQIVDMEHRLVENADLVVTTSGPLAEHVRKVRESVVVRNAADVSFFAKAARFEAQRDPAKRPVIGYFGAIAEWFEVSWIERCAKSRPEWDFVLIGQTFGADVEGLRTMPNVHLLGEQPYHELPRFLSEFDVALIPFQINELITCTNPVKMYEYMAAGKPVVASPMPEVLHATNLVYVARDAVEFEAQIAAALAEDSPDLRRQRHQWASEHTWRRRARDFAHAVRSATPRVSVIILAYNNWEFTRACIHSVLTLSDYPELEVIVVDNASSDETRAELEHIVARDPRVTLVLNDTNLGFAGGNNAGMRAATGDILILLNNDTYVTSGWVRELIRPLLRDERVGLAGPLTNNIGNEQKISINYGNMQEMEATTRRFARRRVRSRYETHNLAFFCVAMRRDVFQSIGELDETYGLGFFEDDDYCNRVRERGYRIVIVDDAFVHHHLSASFNKLGSQEKQVQMERNRAIYEKRWGAWKPHAYRDAPGFGE